ncbi:MAG: Hpt domain-containing protein [Cellvibrionaceae bacterium]
MTDSVTLPEFEGFDTNGLLERLRGKTDRVNQILESFRTNYASAASDLDKLVEENETEEAHRLLHSLKGVTGNLFMHSFYDFIVQFEGEFKAGDMDNYAPRLQEFSQMIDSTLSQIEQVQTVLNQ